jgi:hypothetical protein
MLNVIITKKEALTIGSKKYGITSGKKDMNGNRDTIYFCSNLVFMQNFNREKQFITI